MRVCVHRLKFAQVFPFPHSLSLELSFFSPPSSLGLGGGGYLSSSQQRGGGEDGSANYDWVLDEKPRGERWRKRRDSIREKRDWM